MANKRWTKKELKEIDDLSFAIAILYERKGTITNPYAPLNEKINEAIRTLADLKNRGTNG